MKHFAILSAATLSLLAGCKNEKNVVKSDTSSDELSRARAAEILRNNSPPSSISKLEFIEGGFERAQKDGFIELAKRPSQYPPVYYRFTEAFLGQASDFLMPDREIGVTISVYDGEAHPLTNGAGISLSRPIGQAIGEVTGITTETSSVRCSVEYVVNYQFPPAMDPLKKYVFTGHRSKAFFQKYDDGWRIVQEN